MLAVEVKDLSYIYSPKTPFQQHALSEVNFTVKEGEIFGIIGATGSGKSTLIMHLNALNKTQSGTVTIFGKNSAEKKNLKEIRQTVGMVFQYPEYQLFEETVEKDVAFGPKNLKVPQEEIAKRVQEALEKVGLDYNAIKDRSPFDLSGGEKRRVAIAGILAMRPKILVLDEPTAGLDPQGRDEIISLIKTIKQSFCPTIIVVSHNLDEIAPLADRIMLLHEGRALAILPPKALFAQKEMIEKATLDFPTAVKIQQQLEQKGCKFPSIALTIEELAAQIIQKGDNNVS